MGVKNCGKWKFGGKIMWKVEIMGSREPSPLDTDISEMCRSNVTKPGTLTSHQKSGETNKITGVEKSGNLKKKLDNFR